MRITVKNKTVKHNLELLKTLLQRSKEKKCKTWIEISTGEIRNQAPAKENKKCWKCFHIEFTTPSKKPLLTVCENSKNSAKVFHLKGWSPKARQVILETLDIINAKLGKSPQGLSSEDFFQKFASAQIVLLSNLKKNQLLIHDIWHKLDREGAEKILEGHPNGTYLFRKDQYTLLLEEEFFEHFDGTVHFCVTLTYLDKTGTVRDKTLVQRDKYLVIFNDNPNLVEPHFSSTHAVMHSIDSSLSHLLKPRKK